MLLVLRIGLLVAASVVLEQDHFYSDSKPFTCTHVALSICDDVDFVAGITMWFTSAWGRM